VLTDYIFGGIVFIVALFFVSYFSNIIKGYRLLQNEKYKNPVVFFTRVGRYVALTYVLNLFLSIKPSSFKNNSRLLKEYILGSQKLSPELTLVLDRISKHIYALVVFLRIMTSIIIIIMLGIITIYILQFFSVL